MKDINERRTQRFQFLLKAYEITGGNELHFINGHAIGEELGFGGQDAQLVMQYLVGEGRIEYRTIGGGISITHFGVLEVEKALSDPDRPTEYFPAVVNIVNVEHMTSSQIQQGTAQNSQSLNVTPDEVGQMGSFILAVIQKLDDLHLEEDRLAEIRAEIATIEAQLASSRPKRGIIVESGRTIRSVLEGGIGSLAAAGLLQLLPQILR